MEKQNNNDNNKTKFEERGAWEWEIEEEQARLLNVLEQRKQKLSEEAAEGSTGPKKEPYVRKMGFFGYFGNLAHYSELDESGKSKTEKQTLIGTIVVIALPILIVIAVNVIKSLLPYSYVSASEFVERWNAAAAESPSGITGGVQISNSVIQEKPSAITLSESAEIIITRKGCDVASIAYKNSEFKGKNFDRSAFVKELIRICVPNCSEEQMKEYLSGFEADERIRSRSGIEGFSVSFEKAESKESIQFSTAIPNSLYSFTNNIVRLDDNYCAFDCTLEEFKNSFNQLSPRSRILGEFTVSSITQHKLRKGNITHYLWVWITEDAAQMIDALVLVHVDNISGKIMGVTYSTPLLDTDYDFNPSATPGLESIPDPDLIFSALGFSKSDVRSKYILEAKNNKNSAFIDGVWVQTGQSTENFSGIPLPWKYIYFLACDSISQCKETEKINSQLSASSSTSSSSTSKSSSSSSKSPSNTQNASPSTISEDGYDNDYYDDNSSSSYSEAPKTSSSYNSNNNSNSNQSTQTPTTSSEPANTKPKAPSPSSNTKIGDIVSFGTYEQDKNTGNGKEDIEWQVLDIQNGKLLLISKYILDEKPYDSRDTLDTSAVTWETSSLRNWLNNTFYSDAFTSSEQQRIQTSSLENADSAENGTLGGNDTQDKVFLLSRSEAEMYFSLDSARKTNTYADADSLERYGYGTAGRKWWLRSPGCNSYDAAFVEYDGEIREYITGGVWHSYGIRPAIWISLT